MVTCDLSIVIVSWNVWDVLRACLLSIEHATRPGAGDGLRSFGPDDQVSTVEVIVVDNASHDGTVENLPADFPWVTLVASERNLGFTAGNNRGYAASQGRFVYFLNPDTELVSDRRHGDSLWRLYTAVRDDPSVGMAGPQLRYPDHALQSSQRRFPTPLTGFFESTWLGRRWPHNPWSQRLHMADWEVDFRHDVDWIVGAAMLARREALEHVRMPAYAGPFDEGFFMYSEEMDLCQRLKRAEWRILHVPETLVIHYEGRSSDQVTAARHIHFNTSKVRYYRKYFGPRWAEWLRRYLLLEFRGQLWVERGKWLIGHKRTLRKARMEAYKQVLASKLEAKNDGRSIPTG